MPPTALTPEQQLASFHTTKANQVLISAAQGSRFAKEVAGDHNPIHDEDAPRFCVPGDLLFALIAARYGLALDLRIRFNGMLRADTPLHFPLSPGSEFSVLGDNDKAYVSVTRGTDLSAPLPALWAFIKAYVACSGTTFPGLLQPLLKAKDVMFNPQRPLVVYDSMRITLTTPPQSHPTISLQHADLAVTGKRGDVTFNFSINEQGRRIGECAKKMVVSGLRPYDSATMMDIIERYESSKKQHRD
jgi:hypothetical protein